MMKRPANPLSILTASGSPSEIARHAERERRRALHTIPPIYQWPERRTVKLGVSVGYLVGADGKRTIHHLDIVDQDWT